MTPVTCFRKGACYSPLMRSVFLAIVLSTAAVAKDYPLTAKVIRVEGRSEGGSGRVGTHYQTAVQIEIGGPAMARSSFTHRG